jgi:glucosamine-6-phosphate deaminase
MGIGENGHIAFNDAHDALFNGTKLTKVIELDKKSRKQQVNNGCFNNINEVSTHALTTIPALVSASYMFLHCTGQEQGRSYYKDNKR